MIFFTVSDAKCHNENEAPPFLPHEKLDPSKCSQVVDSRVNILNCSCPRLSSNSFPRGIILSVKPFKEMSLPDGGNFSSIVTKENTDNDQQEQSRGEIIGIEDNVEGGMSDDLPRTQATKGVFIDLS